MPGGLLEAFITSFLATIGFAAVLRAPQRSWIPASLIGSAGYVIYWLLLKAGMNDPNAIFIGSCAASLLAQFTARRLQMIATIFSVLAIIPCVPGYGLYQCMFYLGQGELSRGASIGVSAMASILMIALGLAVGGFIFRFIMSVRQRHAQQ